MEQCQVTCGVAVVWTKCCKDAPNVYQDGGPCCTATVGNELLGPKLWRVDGDGKVLFFYDRDHSEAASYRKDDWG